MEIALNNYGRTSSARTARSHTLVVGLGGLEIFFSYETPIAFAIEGEITIRKNDFSCTTGKHLNWVDANKSKRIEGPEFEKRLEEAILCYRKGEKYEYTEPVVMGPKRVFTFRLGDSGTLPPNTLCVGRRSDV